MRLSLNARLALAVVAALVLPSLIAWGARSLSAGPGDSARPAAARPSSTTPSQSSRPSSGSSQADVAGPVAPAQQASRVPTSLRPEAPTAVRLPNGTTVPVVPVRTRGDGSLDVPDDLRTAGWWRGGARVGDPFGSMLVAAHVDAIDRGLGPFVALLTVRSGAVFTVTTKHLTQRFRVSERRVIDRDRLGSAPWVSSYTGPHRLTLVTCAPPYVRSEGGYQNLAVVVAEPVGPPTRA